MSPDSLKICFTFGKLLAPFYSLAMRLRAALYANGLFSSEKLSLPVISIGNLTMGGTGKTPVVMYIVRLLGQEYKPAVISRGYGGKSVKPVTIVSDGQSVLLGPDAAGDEPVLLAQALPGVPVLTGAKRVKTGRHIEAGRLADLIVMDDGFQHLALARDLNLVLFSGDELLGDGWVFPGGVLREPVSALGRADAFIITGVTEQNKAKVEKFKDRLGHRFSDTPIFDIHYRIAGFVAHGTDPQQLPVAALLGKKLFGFCGIAKPEGFFSALRGAGLLLSGMQAFADHHRYSENDLRLLSEGAQQAGCDGLVTTAKDFVKVKNMSVPLPIWVAQLNLIASHDFDMFVLGTVRRAGAALNADI
nr:tetraacyldisaccharide 4'-kinase [Desulfobulbaceae bacterium]